MSSQQTFTIDGSHTTVGFSVRHMMVARVRGRFSQVEGTIVGDPTDLSNATIEATIDTASINTDEADRDAHLRSDDFFNSEEFPTITFKSTSIERKGDDRYVVHGDLTIKGTTQPVQLDTEVEGYVEKDMYGNPRMGLRAEGKISRKDFGLTWNVALETGGFVVGDEVRIEMDVEAIVAQ